jgi:TetR/AcrR family transcriptional repressor of nem operon
MWEGSYGSVTIDHICQKANVKKGSFYYFYKSKSALAVDALEKLWSDCWKPKMDACFSSSLDPIERMTNNLASVYTSSLEAKAKFGRMVGCPVFTVGSEVSSQEAEVSAVIRDILSRKRRYYETAIRDAVAQGSIEPCDPATEAQALQGLIEGMVSQSRIMNDPEVLRSLPSMAMGMLRVKQTKTASTPGVPVVA